MHIEQVQAEHLYFSSAYDKESNSTARHLLYAKLPFSSFTTAVQRELRIIDPQE